MRRKPEPRPAAANLPEGAIADPLGKLWSDLDWVLVGGPEVTYALDDLSKAVDVVWDPEYHPIAVSVDVDALLDEMRRRLAEGRRMGEITLPPFDPLREYLQDLRAREAPMMIVPPGR